MEMKKLKNLIDTFKDKASIIKATFSFHRHNPSIKLAVVRATTHGASNPPSESRVAAVLAIGDDFPWTACACIETLMDRLHSTSNAAVAMKSLFTLHFIVIHGSYNLKDQAAVFPHYGGRNFLNLSAFRDVSDSETSDLSSWVRWYAGVVEQYMMVWRNIGLGLYYMSRNDRVGDKESKIISDRVHMGLSSAELDVLVGFAEKVSEFPESLHLQKNDLVYEVVRLVMENYRLVQREIFIRVKKLRERVEILSQDELVRFDLTLTRYEDCRRKLLSLFVNRGKNEDLWDLIDKTKTKLIEEKERMKMMVVVEPRSRPGRFWNPFVEPAGELLWIQSNDEPIMGPALLPLTVSTVR